LDLFGIDITLLIPIVAGVALAGIMALVFYFVILKPRITQPLPNERPLGFWSIWLPKGFGLKAGNATTARHTLEREFTRLIENETDETVKRQLKDAQKIFDVFYPIAHKVGRETFIYLFDKNPEDQRFMDVDPNQNDSYIIHGVQDVISKGEYGGLQVLGLKIDPQTKSFSELEENLMEIGLDIVKYITNAAKNVEEIYELKDELKFTKESLKKGLDERAEMRSKLDRAMSALSQKPLTQSEEVKLKGTFVEKMKEWFRPIQLITALAAFLLAPYILTWMNVQVEYPITSYFAALVTILGFFIIPIGKKIFGRWLS